jgi:hypothetical protein
MNQHLEMKGHFPILLSLSHSEVCVDCLWNIHCVLNGNVNVKTECLLRVITLILDGQDIRCLYSGVESD